MTGAISSKELGINIAEQIKAVGILMQSIEWQAELMKM